MELDIENIETTAKIPHLLKYMGSKREILDFVIGSIESLNVESEWLCDLFAGSCIVSASLKGKYKIHANDIQEYSKVLAHTYLSNLKGSIPYNRLSQIKVKVSYFVSQFKRKYKNLNFSYENVHNLRDFQELETDQQKLIEKDFDLGFHLFTRYYSGTYWTYEQCVWIDSIRAVAEGYIGKPEYYPILSSLIYAMSYVAQSTGHYAQYRDAISESSMRDILIYRNREIWPYFEKKFNELILSLNGNALEFKATSRDYLDCIRIIEENSIVYADPPYQSVHYSRFYHILETLVRYDYPKVQYKGRYREERHQSPFCKTTTVKKAFEDLFNGVNDKKAHLVISYSDTGLINLNQIKEISSKVLKNKYSCNILEIAHLHSKMGRSDVRNQDVKEYSIIFKRK